MPKLHHVFTWSMYVCIVAQKVPNFFKPPNKLLPPSACKLR